MSSKSNRHGEYTIKGSGVNSQGNHWCSRDFGSDKTGFHYSNQDGSYAYKNPDNSSYFNDGKGSSRYTAPDGKTHDTSKR